ncbi:MAG: hypothetical protein IPF66_22460 [Holophagales bacterium]|nr:hypothetical protein [Holophagales bacterium]
MIAEGEEPERSLRRTLRRESLRVLHQLHQREKQLVSFARFEESPCTGHLSRRVLPLHGLKARLALSIGPVEPDGFGPDGRIERTRVGVPAILRPDVRQPRHDRRLLEGVRHRPERPGAVLLDRDVTVELPRARERVAPAPLRCFGAVGVTAGRDERPDDAQVLVVDESVLVHIDAPGGRRVRRTDPARER